MKKKTKKRAARAARKNPVRRLSRVRRGGERQVRRLRAIRAQLHKRGILIPTRARFKVYKRGKGYVAEVANYPYHIDAKTRAGATAAAKKAIRSGVTWAMERGSAIRKNPSWLASQYYVAGAVYTDRGRVAGYWTGRNFDDKPDKARAYTTKARAVTGARSALKIAPGAKVAVFSGDVTLHAIKRKLKL